MAAKETHTTARPVRIPEEDWVEFGVLVGDRERSRILREFVAWYLRRPKATLPKRPEPQHQRGVQAAKNISES